MSRIFTAAVFIALPTANTSKLGYSEVWYIHNLEEYIVIQMSKLQPHETSQVCLKNIEDNTRRYALYNPTV